MKLFKLEEMAENIQLEIDLLTKHPVTLTTGNKVEIWRLTSELEKLHKKIDKRT